MYVAISRACKQFVRYYMTTKITTDEQREKLFDQDEYLPAKGTWYVPLRPGETEHIVDSLIRRSMLVQPREGRAWAHWKDQLWLDAAIVNKGMRRERGGDGNKRIVEQGNPSNGVAGDSDSHSQQDNHEGSNQEGATLPRGKLVKVGGVRFFAYPLRDEMSMKPSSVVSKKHQNDNDAERPSKKPRQE